MGGIPAQLGGCQRFLLDTTQGFKCVGLTAFGTDVLAFAGGKHFLAWWFQYVLGVCELSAEQIRKSFASMRTGGRGTEEGSGVSPFRWALYKSLMFRVVRSCDADIGLDECALSTVQTGKR